MRRFIAVKIIHDIEKRIDFSFLAEFLRMLGIFVGENIINEEHSDDSNDCFDAFIYIGKQDNRAEIMLPKGTIVFENICSEIFESQNITYSGLEIPVFRELEHYQGNVLLNCLKEIISNSNIDSEQLNDNILKMLIKVYVDQNLMLNSLNLQYYAKKDSEPIKMALKRFSEAYQVLEMNSVDLNMKKNPYFMYALIWCGVKVNLACDYNNKILFVPVKELSEQCRRLCFEYPDFVNAKVLLGLCYEPLPESALEAVNAFREALNCLKEECYSSSILYWIGKRYESYITHKEMAEQSYRKACEKKEKYKNLFKIAIFQRDKGENEAAIETLKHLIHKLEPKMSMKMADSLELEYIFKVYYQICYIYLQKKQKYYEAIKYGEAAIKIKKKAVKENLFINLLYASEAECYRKILLERLDLSNIYWILSVAYSRILDEDNAKKYREKVMENER